MSSTDRQNRLLLAEDWKRIYQSYSNAEFKSYDFDNLRRTMINYLRENYPEDFNDYIESSEYLAIIDLIAFLGQNFAFRTDLNARENFLELAERRDSVLRLARLLSYNPKRNQAANGLLKIESVSTTESIVDSNNVNLSGQTIIWNDPANSDWLEQFNKIMNSALPVNASIGNPVKQENVSGIPTNQYRLQSTSTDLPVYSFTKVIDGKSARFEIVSTDINDGNILEEPPFPGNNFALLYRDDGRGAGSTNSGWFSHFRQGTLDQGTFQLTNSGPNRVVAVDATNINNSDVWLYALDDFGFEEELWTKVDAIEGNNVIYNSLNKNIRNIYGVLTRIQDRVSVIFSDGVFGNLPNGNFRLYYRTSRNTSLTIKPTEMRGISIQIPYVSKVGKAETLSITYALNYTVDNSTVSESNASIKSNAPATYYTQNRMITGEDYQLGPLNVSQEIIKAKTVNRVSSGISRYFDLIDATGKYSKTNLFGVDGSVYKEYLSQKTSFDFTTRTDIEGAIVNIIEPLLASKEMRNYYYDKFPKVFVRDLKNKWVSSTTDTNESTGYFVNADGLKSQLGRFTGSTLKLIKPGTLLKFEAPTGYHFMTTDNNKLMLGSADHPGAVEYLWTKVISVEGDGTTVADDGAGPVVLNDIIPEDATLVQILPFLSNKIIDDVRTQMTDQIFSYKTFGLRYDTNDTTWKVIINNNLDTKSAFSTGKTGNNANLQLDASWLLLFETNGEQYTITYRNMRYIFESDKEIRFFFDSSDKIYESTTGKIVKDKISVMEINTKPDTTSPFTVNYDWEITKEYRDREGYVNSKKVQVTFFDEDDDGVVDNPEIFDTIVDEDVNPLDKLVFQKKYITTDGSEDYFYVSKDELGIKVFDKKDNIGALSQYTDQQLFYYKEEDIFEVYNKTNSTLSISSDYRANVGRDNIKFQYVHAADSNTRIDPSASNIMDTYLLTRSYDTLFRQWIDDAISSKPLPPSTDALELNFGVELDKIKSISDEVIYHPVKYKVLFGNKAEDDLQATFKIVKNPDLVINDNDLKSRVISSINRFFAIENWEFGEKFYFSELSGFVMNELAPDLVTFVIVPVQNNQTFGSLYEIKSESDEIFISGAKVSDIEIIDAITASRLKAQNVVTEKTTNNVGIQSNAGTNITYVTSSSSSSSGSSGGSSY